MHTVCVTEHAGEFGPYLEAALRRAGLSNRAAARLSGVTDVTIGTYINGKARPTAPTLRQLVRTIGLDPEEAFAKVGLPVPADLVSLRASSAGLTNAELLSLLKDRLFSPAAPEASPSLPPVQLTDAQIRARGRTIARLNVIVDEAREVGDDTAAGALCDLVDALNAQLEAAMAIEVSESQSQRRHPANDG